MRVNKLSGIVMRVTAVLICLVLFSAHLASGMFAKYTVGASEESNARVAKLNVNVKPSEEGLTFDASLNGTYQFFVSNHDSEVAFQCEKIIVRIKSDDPNNIFNPSEAALASEMKLNDLDGTYSESDNQYTFDLTDVYLKPGMDSNVFTLTFKASDLVKINTDATEPVTNTTIPIQLDVYASGSQVM